MNFPGIDKFEVTAPIAHAIFTLREGIPPGCVSIQVELDERGAAFVTATRRDGTCADAPPSEDVLSAAGMLLTHISYQVIMLSRHYRTEGQAAVDAAQRRLTMSLAEVGLSVGLLDDSLADTIKVTAAH